MLLEIAGWEVRPLQQFGPVQHRNIEQYWRGEVSPLQQFSVNSNFESYFVKWQGP